MHDAWPCLSLRIRTIQFVRQPSEYLEDRSFSWVSKYPLGDVGGLIQQCFCLAHVFLRIYPSTLPIPHFLGIHFQMNSNDCP